MARLAQEQRSMVSPLYVVDELANDSVPGVGEYAQMFGGPDHCVTTSFRGQAVRPLDERRLALPVAPAVHEGEHEAERDDRRDVAPQWPEQPAHPLERAAIRFLRMGGPAISSYRE